MFRQWAEPPYKLKTLRTPARGKPIMAEHGEWNRKGAVLSDVTATREFGVSRDFIVEGIRAGKLEVRHGSVWGNPYLRVLRRELEAYLAERLGDAAFRGKKAKVELKKVNQQIAELEQQLADLRARQAAYEADLAAAPPAAEPGVPPAAEGPAGRRGRPRRARGEPNRI